MKNFAIIEPFNLDWRMTAPKDFETLEYFVTPEVSLVFHQVTSGGKLFKIGAYIMQDPNKAQQFNAEYMPQRSQERIEQAFKDENISVFFSLEDGKGLSATFQEEKFICRKLEVHYNGLAISVPELPEAEFHKVIEVFSQLKVVSIMDFQKNWEGIEEEIDNIREEVARGMRKESAKRDMKMMGTTKKSMTVRGIVGAGLMVASTILGGYSKKFAKAEKKGKLFASAIMGIGALVCGMAGKNMLTRVVEQVQKGLVVSYG